MSSGPKTIQSTADTTQAGKESSTMQPHSAAAPGYGFIGGNMQNMMQQPTPFFPGQTYVGPSAPTQGAVNSAMNMANNYMPGVLGQSGQNFGFLSNAADVANNSYVQNMNQMTQQNLNQNLNENLLPGVNAGAQQVNAMGSGRHGLMQGKAVGDTQRAIADAQTQTNLGAYGQGLGAQQFALGQTGNLLSSMMAPSRAMAQAGQTVEDYQGRALQDAMQRHQYQFQEPWQRMQNTSSMLGVLQPLGVNQGANFSQGQSTTTQPNPAYKSPFQNALGIGMTGLGLASGLGWAPLAAGAAGAAMGG